METINYIVILCLSTAAGTLVEVPKNTAVQGGGHAVMACKSVNDDLVRVKWYTYKIDEDNTLYNGYRVRQTAQSYCRITKEPGRQDLVFNDTRSAAQTYICWEPGTLQSASAELIWIKTDPTCVHEVIQNSSRMTCSIEFRGNWPPTMEWSKKHRWGEEIHSVEVSVSDERVSSTLTTNVKNGETYACTTKFDIRDKPARTTATNVPEYRHVWVALADIQGQASQGQKLTKYLIILYMITIATVLK